MKGLMMDYPLTLSTIFRRAEQLFGPRRNRLAPARQVDPPLHLCRLCGPRRRLGVA